MGGDDFDPCMGESMSSDVKNGDEATGASSRKKRWLA